MRDIILNFLSRKIQDPSFSRAPLRYGAAVLGVALAALGRWAIGGLLGDTSQYAFYYAVVMWAAAIGGRGPGLTATSLGAIAGFGHFAGTREPAFAATPDALVRLALFLGVGLFVSVLAGRLRDAAVDMRGKDEAARAVERRFRALFESVPSPLWEADCSAVQARCRSLREAGVADPGEHVRHRPEEARALADRIRIVGANRAALECFGAPDTDALLSDREAYLGEEARPAFERAAAVLAAGLGRVDVEMPFRARGGDVRVASMRVSVVPGFESTLERVVIAFDDITERKKTEEALRDAQARLDGVLAAGAIGVWTWAPPGDRLVGDANAAALFDIDVEEARAGAIQSYLRRIHPEDRPAVEAALSRALRDGAPCDFDCRVVRRDGATRWIAARGRARPHADGRPASVIGFVQDITERKAVEKALRDGEARFREIADLACDYAYALRVEEDGTLQSEWIVGTFERITGWRPEDLDQVGGWRALVHPDDLASGRRRVQRLLDGEPDASDFRILARDGTVRWLRDQARPVRDARGRVVRLLGAALDVTDRKRAEEALREREELLRSIIDNAGAAIYAKDLEGRFLLCNRHHAALLGASPDAVLGKTESDFAAPAGRIAKSQTVDYNVMATGRAVETEEVVALAGGERAFLSVKFPLRDSGGAITAVCGISTDITDRRRQELAARRALARVELLAQTAADLLASERPRTVVERLCTRVMEHLDCQCFFIFLLDEASGRLRLNACAGIPTEEARRLEWLEKGTSVCGCVAQTGRRIVAERIPTTADPRTDRVRGYGVRAYACHPLSAGGRTIGTLSFGARTRETFAEDELSMMKAMADLAATAMERERLLEQARRQTEDLNRVNAAKDRFLATLSHALRTPLMPILAVVSIGLRNPRLPRALRENLAMIRRNVELEVALVDDLLDVTRIAAGKLRVEKRPIDGAAVVREAVRLCAGEAEAKGLRLTVDTPGAPYPLEADAARLHQVFWNLIRNAIAFTPPLGRIGVSAAARGETLTVAVTDTGVGIAPSLLPRLFAPFEQGPDDPSRRGCNLGLGLAIAKALVGLHGGQITAASDGPGRGATFTVLLPMTSASRLAPARAPAVAATAVPMPPPRPSRPFRLLLVEDHDDTASTMARLLAAEGYLVTRADSMQAALAAAEAGIDIMVSDLALPDGSGIDLLRLLRTRGFRAKAVCLSGYGSAADVRKSLEAGFAVHLTKPVDFDILRRTLLRVAAADPRKTNRARRSGAADRRR